MPKGKIVRSFLLTITASGLFFLFSFSLAKILGAAEYGEIVYYLSFVNIIVIATGLNHPSLYMGSKIIDSNDNTFSLFFTYHLILFTLLSPPLYYLLLWFVEDSSIVALILLIAFFTVILKSAALEYNSNKDVENSIKIATLYPRVLLIVLFGGAIVLHVNTPTIYLLSFLLATLFFFLVVLARFKPKLYLQGSLAKRAWKFYVLGIVGTTFGHLAQIAQKHFGGYEQVGTLAVVLLFFAGLGLINDLLVKFILPAMHQHYKEHQLKKIAQLYQSNTLLVTLLIAPLLLFLTFYIHAVANLLGSGYSFLPLYFYVLVGGYSFDLLTGITGNILRTTGHEKLEIYNELARLSVGILSLYVLQNNDYSVVVAILLSTLVYNLLKLFEVYYLFKFLPFSAKKLGGIVVFLSLLGGLHYCFLHFYSSHICYTLELLLFVGTYLAVYKYITANKTLLKGYLL